jgi:hypothetical protein
MPVSLQSPRFRGLRLAVADDDAAAAVIEGVFNAPPVPSNSVAGRRFVFGDRWIEMRAASDHAFAFRCKDLDAQRTHLQRLGVEALDGSALGCTPRLLLDPMDTGACIVDLQALEAERPPAPSAAHLCGVELAVRTPERVALHWAQLFHAACSRDAGGLPTLRLDRFSLRFVPASDGRTRVTALEFTTGALDALASNATAQGFRLRRDARQAAFSALGIAFTLRCPE